MDMWMIVALLGIVVILYASMLPRAPERKPEPDDFLDSVGDTLQHFADEIEDENKELLRMIGEMKQAHEQRTNTLLQRIEQLEKQSAAAQDFMHRKPAHEAETSAGALKAAPAVRVEAPSAVPYTASSPLPSETPSRFADTVKARHKDLFDLYNHGKSIEYIAKKLGKNKGEVQLIIALARQEEPLHGQQ